MKNQRVAAVIAAAGLSSRMGDFKPLLQIGQVSIIQRVITSFRQAGCDPIVVVTGYRGEDLKKHLAKQNVVCLMNDEYETTEMFDSAKIAFRWLKDKCDALFFTPGDVPLFTEATLQALLEEEHTAAVPLCEGKTGHPLYLDATLLPKLIEHDGEGGMKGVLESLGLVPHPVPVRDQGVLFDADTQEDYQKLVSLHNAQLLRPELRITLTRETPFFGPGTALLLQLVQQTESVALASQRMGISYSKCWQMIRGLEREAGFTVVERQAGGSGGGNSELTEKGMELLRRYRRMTNRCKTAMDAIYAEECACFWDEKKE